jgi:hypothetical protein
VAFVRKPGGLVRGTFDGRYVVISVPADATDAEVHRMLQVEFVRGAGDRIPAEGFAPLTADVAA